MSNSQSSSQTLLAGTDDDKNVEKSMASTSQNDTRPSPFLSPEVLNQLGEQFKHLQETDGWQIPSSKRRSFRPSAELFERRMSIMDVDLETLSLAMSYDRGETAESGTVEAKMRELERQISMLSVDMEEPTTIKGRIYERTLSAISSGDLVQMPRTDVTALDRRLSTLSMTDDDLRNELFPDEQPPSVRCLPPMAPRESDVKVGVVYDHIMEGHIGTPGMQNSA